MTPGVRARGNNEFTTSYAPHLLLFSCVVVVSLLPRAQACSLAKLGTQAVKLMERLDSLPGKVPWRVCFVSFDHVYRLCSVVLSCFLATRGEWTGYYCHQKHVPSRYHAVEECLCRPRVSTVRTCARGLRLKRRGKHEGNRTSDTRSCYHFFSLKPCDLSLLRYSRAPKLRLFGGRIRSYDDFICSLFTSVGHARLPSKSH